MKIASRRNLRRMVSGDRRKIVKLMKKDLNSLIKPKPKCLPKFLWLWILKKLLITDETFIVKKYAKQ